MMHFHSRANRRSRASFQPCLEVLEARAQPGSMLTGAHAWDSLESAVAFLDCNPAGSGGSHTAAQRRDPFAQQGSQLSPAPDLAGAAAQPDLPKTGGGSSEAFQERADGFSIP